MADNRNRIQIRRTLTPGNVPLVENMREGELAVNLVDKKIFVSSGVEIIHLNHASNVETDSTHRFLTDAQIEAAFAAASKTTSGNVKVGDNIDVDDAGVISVKTASATETGVVTSEDFNTFMGKQDDLGYTPVDKAGDSMTGPLTLPGAPTENNHASNKKYVDDGLNTKLDKAGGVLTGPLTLNGDPTEALHATPKQYVDNAVNNISGKYAAPVQSLEELSAVAPAFREDKQMRLVEDTGAIYRFDAQASEASDENGVVAPDDAPITGRWLKVSAATQNHENLFGLQGGADGDHMHLTTAEKNSYDAHLNDNSKHLTEEQNTWIDAINATSAEVNHLQGVTAPIQEQIDSKQDNIGYVPVNKAGDTMAGPLELAADPTSAMQAATKQYVDTFVIDGGTF